MNEAGLGGIPTGPGGAPADLAAVNSAKLDEIMGMLQMIIGALGLDQPQPDQVPVDGPVV